MRKDEFPLIEKYARGEVVGELMKLKKELEKERDAWKDKVRFYGLQVAIDKIEKRIGELNDG